MGYTLVIVKIRFENLTRILHFPNLTCQDKTLLEQDNSYMESLRLDNETNDFLPNNGSSPKKIFMIFFRF